MQLMTCIIVTMISGFTCTEHVAAVKLFLASAAAFRFPLFAVSAAPATRCQGEARALG